MGFEVGMGMFRWLQKLELAKESKRSANKIELTSEVTTKFFDGLYVGRIVQMLYK